MQESTEFFEGCLETATIISSEVASEITIQEPQKIIPTTNFIEYRIDPTINDLDEYGYSKFHYALADVESIAEIRLMIDKGADVNRTTGNGDTPLIHTILWSNSLHDVTNYVREDRCYKIIHLLLHKKADCSQTNRRGVTPLYYARQLDQTAIEYLLITAHYKKNYQQRSFLTRPLSLFSK